MIRKENTSLLRRCTNAEQDGGYLLSITVGALSQMILSVFEQIQRNCCWESISGSGESPPKPKEFGLTQGMGFLVWE
jgi:hypothetical protein